MVAGRKLLTKPLTYQQKQGKSQICLVLFNK